MSNSNLINALVFSDKDELPWQFTRVYGPPIPSLRRFFWHALYDVASAFIGPWLLLGDFNTVLVQVDKSKGRPIASSSSGGLNGLITEFGFLDLGFNGCPYIWSNWRAGSTNIQARLD